MKLFENVGGNQFKLANEYSVPGNEHISFIGWNDLCNMAVEVPYALPEGTVDFWTLVRLSNISPKDIGSESPKFFKFMIGISKYVIHFFKKMGGKVELKSLDELEKEWSSAKNANN
jgi:hypothetical protein